MCKNTVVWLKMKKMWNKSAWGLKLTNTVIHINHYLLLKHKDTHLNQRFLTYILYFAMLYKNKQQKTLTSTVTPRFGFSSQWMKVIQATDKMQTLNAIKIIYPLIHAFKCRKISNITMWQIHLCKKYCRVWLLTSTTKDE